MSAPSVRALTLPGLPGSGYELVGPGGGLTAQVAPADGGQVSGLQWSGYGELLYRANQFAPPPAGQWSGRAPLLWPAVGRNFTPAALAQAEPQCCFERDGVVYDLPIHGFARLLPWTVTDCGCTSDSAWITQALAADDGTRAVYPWDFSLTKRHAIGANWWECRVTVSGPQPLGFGIGNHLSVQLPPGGLAQSTLSGSVTGRHDLARTGLLSGSVAPLELRSPVPLTDPAWHNAVLENAGPEAWLTVTFPAGQRLTVGQAITQGEKYVETEDVLFVLYGNPAHDYYCPEPWIGWPNGLQTGRGAVELPAGATFEWVMRVTLEA
ncbi:MAG: hypothetical protein IT204_01410 [Fimbriimonadaceae bacterium]|nr:hypothetical protein [Fimbriimonadaceae bacterium]